MLIIDAQHLVYRVPCDIHCIPIYATVIFSESLEVRLQPFYDVFIWYLRVNHYILRLEDFALTLKNDIELFTGLALFIQHCSYLAHSLDTYVRCQVDEASIFLRLVRRLTLFIVTPLSQQ